MSRDIGSQSTIGALYTDREVNGFFNRVGSVDGRFNLNDHWALNAQAVFSATLNPQDATFNQFNTTGGISLVTPKKLSCSGTGLSCTTFWTIPTAAPISGP